MRPTKPITKVLVANRGEVAVRVMRTCREMGLGTVAVYSDVDRGSVHVRHADEAVHVGGASPRESYLAVDRIVDAAKRTGADAIHPGHGFLSERAELARAAERAGIAFVGGTAESLEALALDAAARRRVRDAGVPTVAGSEGAIDDEADARALAEGLGYPVLIKPAGRDGESTRRCDRPEDFAELWRAAGAAAAAALGDGRLFLEKHLARARHVEVQVLADLHGGVVSLGEREGSVQRRGQQAIVEAPSCALDDELRRTTDEVAVRAARALGLVGAGTVELLLDGQRRLHFSRLTARLSEAHAVTEMTTGVDLVRLQLEVAQGGRVPPQETIVRRGHAVAARIRAEDPAAGFAPSPGKITYLRVPGGPGVRDDSGVYTGWVMPPHHEPALSTLAAWAPSRPLAVDRLVRALGEYIVHGVKTNVGWLAAALDHPDLRSGAYDTGFAARHAEALVRPAARSWEDVALIAAAVAAYERDQDEGQAPGRSPGGRSAWARSAPLRGARGGGR